MRIGASGLRAHPRRGRGDKQDVAQPVLRATGGSPHGRGYAASPSRGSLSLPSPGFTLSLLFGSLRQNVQISNDEKNVSEDVRWSLISGVGALVTGQRDLEVRFDPHHFR